ncbi:hypothetical protein [Rubinisphaera margarita]|uniref:hypothetical protein n=1 Tax=Rubinisphaera margarita TaxID=2909586 RepID=UPI001EE924DF|nr:hypothetical protein [Rubinisphaera margarita]MCG6154169.1 hypothetical protein [Rubinisphaera margarita]
MDYPSELDLLEFFETEPKVEGDVQTYQVQDSSGATLAFSFDTSDDSVQTLLKCDERIVSLISHECLTRMWIDGATLHAELENSGYRISLSLVLRPLVQIKWSGLRTG